MKLLLFFPIIEIILLVLFGDIFGFLNVILWIIFSAIVGFWLLINSSGNIELIKDINKPLDWIFKKVSGVLMIIPGFATDFLGIFLLVKPLRGVIWKIMPNNFKNFGGEFWYNFKKKNNEKNITDVEYKNLDE